MLVTEHFLKSASAMSAKQVTVIHSLDIKYGSIGDDPYNTEIHPLPCTVNQEVQIRRLYRVSTYPTIPPTSPWAQATINHSNALKTNPHVNFMPDPDYQTHLCRDARPCSLQ